MTEDEAKTKWCPMIRRHNASVGWHKATLEGCELTCIASNCMMWRWHINDASGDGYCGLAGKP